MRDKRIKLIYFSLKGSEVKDFAIGWRKLLLFSSMVLVILIIAIGAGFNLFTDIYHNNQVMSLNKINRSLLEELQEVKSRFGDIKSQVHLLEGDDDERRMIVGLDTLAKDMREVGTGGPDLSHPSDFDLFPKEMRDEVINTRDLIDQLNRKIKLLNKSREHVSKTLANKNDQTRHLPTIMPVSGGRISSSFGWRVDPFTDQRTRHGGLDIAAPKRTLVYAAADGMVVKIKNSYVANKNYGKYIIIDHEYGRQTLYAHLHKIKVKPGSRVKRWDVIGEVGDTGRAQGDHLHYEVVVNGKKVNPTLFVFK